MIHYPHVKSLQIRRVLLGSPEWIACGNPLCVPRVQTLLQLDRVCLMVHLMVTNNVHVQERFLFGDHLKNVRMNFRYCDS